MICVTVIDGFLQHFAENLLKRFPSQFNREFRMESDLKWPYAIRRASEIWSEEKCSAEEKDERTLTTLTFVILHGDGFFLFDVLWRLDVLHRPTLMRITGHRRVSNEFVLDDAVELFVHVIQCFIQSRWNRERLTKNIDGQMRRLMTNIDQTTLIGNGHEPMSFEGELAPFELLIKLSA